MIRNALLGPLARFLRPRLRAGPLEGALEYVLFLIGWILWLPDALARLAALARHAGWGPRAGAIQARGIVLLRAQGDAAARASAERRLAEADDLLRRHRLELRVIAIETRPWPGPVAPPTCGPGALWGGFFRWASARSSASPDLTIYFVEDFGSLAGCAVPGADWIVVELGGDGTTLVHEIGHLADLWLHSPDPDNVMSDRPGGRHDGVTPFQEALFHTTRFVRR